MTGFNIKEVNGDLFSAAADYSMCHCVAADLRMGKGIAIKFRWVLYRITKAEIIYIYILISFKEQIWSGCRVAEAKRAAWRRGYSATRRALHLLSHYQAEQLGQADVPVAAQLPECHAAAYGKRVVPTIYTPFNLPLFLLAKAQRAQAGATPHWVRPRRS